MKRLQISTHLFNDKLNKDENQFLFSRSNALLRG